jgi:hypothetical protein
VHVIRLTEEYMSWLHETGLFLDKVHKAEVLRRTVRGCQFSSTASRSRQNRIPFRPRDKQVPLKSVEGFICFRPRDKQVPLKPVEGFICFRPRDIQVPHKSVEGFICFRPRDKQVPLKPVEGFICFRPRLVIIRACIFIGKNNTTEVSRCATAKLYLVSLNDVTLVSYLSIYMLSQSGSINMLFTFFFSQPNSVATSLTYPGSDRSQFLAVILLILRAICV